jgi:hypothetical protein
MLERAAHIQRMILKPVQPHQIRGLYYLFRIKDKKIVAMPKINRAKLEEKRKLERIQLDKRLRQCKKQRVPSCTLH